MIKPTDKQNAVLDYIISEISTGLPPTINDIKTAFGWRSQQSAVTHLTALEKKGLIRRESRHRGIFVIKQLDIV